MKQLIYSVQEREQRFYAQLTLSSATLKNYRQAINGQFLSDMLREFDSETLFELTDLNTLWDLYSKINLHPKNIANHRAYSSAIMKYIRFLNNGQKVGHRIDYNRPRKRDE